MDDDEKSLQRLVGGRLIMRIHEVDIHLAISAFALGASCGLLTVFLWRKK